MMNGVDSRPALPNPRFRKKRRRESDMESSSFYTLERSDASCGSSPPAHQGIRSIRPPAARASVTSSGRDYGSLNRGPSFLPICSKRSASEFDPEHELHTPRRAGPNGSGVQHPGDAPEAGRRRDIGRGIGKNRVVEQVERFDAELQIRFLPDRREFLERAVYFPERGAAGSIAS